MPPGFSCSDFYYLLPELVLTVGALLLLIVDVLLPRACGSLLAWVAVGGARRRPATALVADRRRTR